MWYVVSLHSLIFKSLLRSIGTRDITIMGTLYSQQSGATSIILKIFDFSKKIMNNKSNNDVICGVRPSSCYVHGMPCFVFLKHTHPLNYCPTYTVYGRSVERKHYYYLILENQDLIIIRLIFA